MPKSPKVLQFTAPKDDPAFPSPARIIPPRSPVLQSLSSDRQGADRMRAAACPEGGQEHSPSRAARSGAAAALPPRVAAPRRGTVPPVHLPDRSSGQTPAHPPQPRRPRRRYDRAPGTAEGRRMRMRRMLPPSGEGGSCGEPLPRHPRGCGGSLGTCSPPAQGADRGGRGPAAPPREMRRGGFLAGQWVPGGVALTRRPLAPRAGVLTLAVGRGLRRGRAGWLCPAAATSGDTPVSPWCGVGGERLALGGGVQGVLIPVPRRRCHRPAATRHPGPLRGGLPIPIMRSDSLHHGG